MNSEIRLSSPNDSMQSYTNDKDEQYDDKIAKQRGKKLKNQNDQNLSSQSKQNISAREQKKIDQYSKLFHQQDLVSVSTNLKAERKKQKKIKVSQSVQEQQLLDLQDVVNDSHEEKMVIEQKVCEDSQLSQQINGTIEFHKTPSEIPKLDTLETNIEDHPFIQDLNQNIVSAQVILQKQELKVPKEVEDFVSFKIHMNPKVKIKEKNHLFLYLSECQDKCQFAMQKLGLVAPQLYSPPRTQNKQISEHSNLFPINQEVFHETQILTSNLITKFKTYGDSIKYVGVDQREFINKYLDKKNLHSVLRDSRMQIFKKGSDKSTLNIQGPNKLQKK